MDGNTRTGPEGTDRIATLVHELSNLLDGSMRCLQVAWESLPEESVGVTSAQLEVARRQVETARGALDRMVETLHAAMEGRTSGGRLGSLGHTTTLAEALFHALDVVRLAASEQGVKLEIRVDAEAGTLPAGSVYPAVLNGLYNAVESIASRGGGGTVELLATREGESIVIEIADDGAGLGEGMGGGGAFAYRASTKGGGSGIGLTICRCSLGEVGGTAELVDRWAEAERGKRGAVLRMRYPVSSVRDETLSKWVGDER